MPSAAYFRIFAKIVHISQIENRFGDMIWETVDMGCFSIFYHYKVSFFYIFIVSLKTQIATQSEIEWKLNFNNLIMED